VNCEQWLEAVSALADGEDPGVEPELVAGHLARCSACRELETQFGHLRRQTLVGQVETMPDLSGRVVKAATLVDRAARRLAVRVLLAAVTVYLVILSLDALLPADGHGEMVHTSRHLGAFTLAYSVALAVVVARPARARTVLPVACTLAAALLLTAVVDITQGHVPPAVEALHLPELLSVLLVWLMAVPDRSGPRSRRRSPATGTATLHLVASADPEGPAADTG
jgi:predicted anti-sigma-YlaC factor YlaD